MITKSIIKETLLNQIYNDGMFKQFDNIPTAADAWATALTQIISLAGAVSPPGVAAAATAAQPALFSALLATMSAAPTITAISSPKIVFDTPVTAFLMTISATILAVAPYNVVIPPAASFSEVFPAIDECKEILTLDDIAEYLSAKIYMWILTATWTPPSGTPIAPWS